MSGRTQELGDKRRALQAKIAAQRGELAAEATALEHRLRFVDRGAAIVRLVASTPVLIIAGAAIILLVRPARLIKWAGNIILLSSAFKRLTRDA